MIIGIFIGTDRITLIPGNISINYIPMSKMRHPWEFLDKKYIAFCFLFFVFQFGLSLWAVLIVTEIVIRSDSQSSWL